MHSVPKALSFFEILYNTGGERDLPLTTVPTTPFAHETLFWFVCILSFKMPQWASRVAMLRGDGLNPSH